MAGKTAVLSVRILGDGKDARRALKSTSKDVSILGGAARRLGGGLGGLTKFAGGFGLIGGAVGGAAIAIKTLLPLAAGLGTAFVGAGVVGAAALIVPLRDMSTVLGDLGPKFSALGDSMSGSFWQAAEAPIRSLVDTLLPSLSSGLTETSRIMGESLGGAAKQLGDTLGPMLPGLMENFNAFFSSAMQGLGPFLTGIFQLMDAGAALLPAIGPGLAALAEQFAGWATQMNESGQIASMFAAVGSTIGTVFSTLAPVIGSVMTLFTTTYTALQPLIGALMQSLAPALTGIATALGPVVTSLGAALLPVIQQLAPVLGGVLVTAVQLFAGVIAQLAPVISQVLTAVMPFVAQLVGALLPVITTLVSTLLPPLVALFAGLAPILIQVLAAVMPLITALAGQLSPLIAGLAPLLMTLVEGFVQVIGAIAPLIPMLVSALVPVIQAIGPLLRTVVSVLTSLLGPAIQMIVGIVDIVVGVLTGDWTKAWEGVKKVVGGAIDFVKAAVKGGLSLVKSIFTSVLGLISSKVRSVFGRLPEPARRAIRQFQDYFSNGFDRVMGIVKNLPSRIRWAIGNLGSLLRNSGRSLIQGFISGIRSMFGAVSRAVSRVVNRVRDFFPFSPAKTGPFSGRGYTTYSGKALVQDFAGAMTKQLVTVRAAANKVAKAGTFTGGFDMLSPSISGRPGGPGNAATVINIKVTADGTTDPDALGRKIVSALDSYYKRRGKKWQPA